MSSFSHSAFDEVCDDLASRFLHNLPESETYALQRIYQLISVPVYQIIRVCIMFVLEMLQEFF